jgi:uncharacterized protein (TIGR04255 family)
VSQEYDYPFLNQVLIRADFDPPIEATDEFATASLAEAVKDNGLPIFEPRTIVGEELQVTPEVMSRQKVMTKEWQYFSEDRADQCVVSPNSLIVIHNEYSEFEHLIEQFQAALGAISVANEDLQIVRVGLRYINLLDLKEARPTSWSRYIAGELIAAIDFAPDPKRLARAMSVMELNYERDIRLKFQFGLPNRDYPASIRQKEFVLDIDGYVAGLMNANELPGLVDAVHQKIKDIFERSITEDLRSLMREPH